MLKTSLTLLLSLYVIASATYAVECVICGCNNEICAKAGENHFSTCLWKAEYECYNKYGICESNAAGECGWRQTPEFSQCIKLRQDQVSAADAFSD